MAKKEFKARKFEDFTIMEDGKVIGHVRIKPSGILWSAKNKQSWKGVTMEQFAKFAKRKGKDQKK